MFGASGHVKCFVPESRSQNPPGNDPQVYLGKVSLQFDGDTTTSRQAYKYKTPLPLHSSSSQKPLRPARPPTSLSPTTTYSLSTMQAMVPSQRTPTSNSNCPADAPRRVHPNITIIGKRAVIENPAIKGQYANISVKELHHCLDIDSLARTNPARAL